MAETPGEARRLTLPATLNATTVTTLVDQLRAIRGAALILDGSAVTRAGGLGLQALISARRTWREDGQPFSIVAASPALAEACVLAGANGLETLKEGPND